LFNGAFACNFLYAGLGAVNLIVLIVFQTTCDGRHPFSRPHYSPLL
jgi:hypothetical protein